MRCDEVAALLPTVVDGTVPPNLAVEHHVESCLRCQAELARYRKLLRTLQQLRTRYIEPTPGLLGETLAAIEEAAERRAVRSILSGRRLAYGAIGGTAVATAATAALLIARSRRRGAPSLSIAS
jgi:anti-sigma factor RsiW